MLERKVWLSEKDMAVIWFVLAAAARPVKSLSVASNVKKKAVPSKQEISDLSFGP